MASNIKDTVSTIAGIAGAAATAVLSAQTQGVVLPPVVVTVCIIVAAVCFAVIGVLQGKNPNGTTKTPEQVVEQNTKSLK